MSMGMTLIGWYLRASRKPIWSNVDRFHANAAKPKANPEPPEAVRARHHITERVVEGFRSFNVQPRAKRAGAPAVLYLHGGGYVNEIAPQHWALISDMADLGVEVEVPIYGLFPQHDWRDAYRFIPAVYADLLSSHGDGNVVVAGDSAGGGLALGLASAVDDLNLARPRSLLLLSPWLDVSCSNPAISRVEPLDPWLGLVGARIAGERWANGGDMRDPRLSPLHIATDALPPTHIFTGTHDIVYPDIELFCRRHPGVKLTVSEGACHVYPLLPVPEGKVGRAQWLEALRQTLPASA